jgi:branched-chain amino acid transport system permease protein
LAVDVVGAIRRNHTRAAEVVGGVGLFFAALHLLWPSPAGVLLHGAVIGSLTSLLALGLALVYRSNRIINFAQGDMGLLGATLAVLLITDKGWPYPAAVLAGCAVSILFGVIVERIFIRPFFRSSRLILTVVTIGTAQVLTAVGLFLPRAFGRQFPPTRFASPFNFTFTVKPIIFQGTDIVAIVVVPLTIIALLSFLRFTSIGIAIRASAERPERASLLGVPVQRIQMVVWALAALLSTIAMTLRAGIVSLPSGGTSTSIGLMIAALAACVIGRMERLGVIFVASLGIGMVDSSIQWDTGRASYVNPVLFAIILIGLLAQRRRRLTRSELTDVSTVIGGANVRPVPPELSSLPEIRGARIALGVVAVLGLFWLSYSLSIAKLNVFGVMLVFCMVAISLNILTGWAGQVSLGHAAFMGIGGFVSAALVIHQGWDLLLTVPLGGFAAAAVATLVGIPALRVRGLYLAVVTLAFGVVTATFLFNTDVNDWVPTSTDVVPRPPLLGRISIATEPQFFRLTVVVLVAVVLMANGVRNSRTGRVLVGVRDNEQAAQAYSVNVTRAKLTAFAVSGFIAGIAGALLVHGQQTFTLTRFEPAEGLRLFTMVIVGGLGTVTGAIAGAVFFQGTNYFIDDVPGALTRAVLSFSTTGVGLLLVLRYMPGGLGGMLFSLRDRFLRRVAAARDIVVPSLVADVRTDEDDARSSRPDSGRSGPPAVSYRSYPDLGSNDANALLSVRSLDVKYGQVQVLFDVDVDVQRGEVLALLGTNGAGKSTVLGAVSGLLDPSAGTVTFDGQDITGMAPHRIAALGVAQVPGGKGVFPSLTVQENLRVASWLQRRDPAYCAVAIERAFDLFPDLIKRRHLPAGSMSGGEQQMLTIAMASVGRPKLLLVDELSLGLAPVIVEQLLRVVAKLRMQGVTIVIVEQSVHTALRLADNAYFLEKGEVRFHGPTAALLERPDVLHSVFLEGAAKSARRRQRVGAGA